MKTKKPTFYLFIFLLIMISGCSSAITVPTQKISESEYNNSRIKHTAYFIGVDDKIKVNVWGNKELSLEMSVRPDGKISMPLIGEVRAGGLTPSALATSIRIKLSPYINKPNVTVILTDLRSYTYISRVRVTGAVVTPTSLPYRPGMTLLDAVLASGGLTEFAAPARTKLYRQINDNTKIYRIDLDAILHDGDLQTNVKLIQGDIIAVPERYF